MSYIITGLDPAPFEALYGLSEAALAERGVIAKIADSKPGFPCRITLEDAEPGERVLLLNHESHSAATPFRSAYAIYIREGARTPARFRDRLPPVFADRPIALRIFNAQGYLIGADLGAGDTLEPKIRQALARPNTAYIHSHNAMHGCFAAEIRPIL